MGASWLTSVAKQRQVEEAAAHIAARRLVLLGASSARPLDVKAFVRDVEVTAAPIACLRNHLTAGFVLQALGSPVFLSGAGPPRATSFGGAIPAERGSGGG